MDLRYTYMYFTCTCVMKEKSSTEAVRSFGDCISRVRHTGEPIAPLSPAPGNSRLTVAEFIEAWQGLGMDSDFASDLEKLGKEDAPLENPWDS